MRRKKRHGNPWVSWEIPPDQPIPDHVIRGEIVSDQTQTPAPPVLPHNPVDRIISDFGGTPAAPVPPAAPGPISPAASPPAGGPPAPPSLPPSWGQPGATGRPQGDRPRLPRVPARPVPVRQLPARQLPAERGRVVQDVARWGRVQTSRALLVAVWTLPAALGALAALALVVGVLTLTGMRWEVEAVAYSALAGAVIRLARDARRLYRLAYTQWRSLAHKARSLATS